MTGKTVDFDSVLKPDQLGVYMSNLWVDWNSRRAEKISSWEELRKYLFATDTTQTTNSKNPWKNKTTLPKLCQIRDNLLANYLANLFPKRKWLAWEAGNRDSNTKETRDIIISYMQSVISYREFKHEMTKCVLDYIDYGNAFGMVEWTDERVELENRMQVGYVGPTVRRISPLDIVFNPIAPSFEQSPKIIRSLVSFGEVKELLERFSTDENREAYEELYKYLRELRTTAANMKPDSAKSKDVAFQIDGFTNFHQYLSSNYCELLTFYGDVYDIETDTFLKNHVITVVDRHKVIEKRPHQSIFGKPPIFHIGWRNRQDNLWAMGPLDNLVGFQYKIDHLENAKADVLDFNLAPMIKIKGYVEPFEWQPYGKIVTSEEGDVEVLAPPYQVLQINNEIAVLLTLMEEMAGSPKEAMGFRTPGEKTKYEVQRLENAASRIFQNKTTQFEEYFSEPILNAMLEMSKRLLTTEVAIKVFDDDLQVEIFQNIQPDALTGLGRIKPIAARHFVEQAELVQNLTGLSNSPLWEFIKQHVSSIGMSNLIEQVFDIEDYELIKPNVLLSEQADAQRLLNTQSEQVMTEAGTAAGIRPDDYDTDMEMGVGMGGMQ